jgi:DNA replication and repair protein RecF
VFVTRLGLHDFRSYDEVDIELGPGVVTFVGRNGQGKTNLVEAIDYLARLESHRVAADLPLVRQGADQAVVRLNVTRGDRSALIELEINPGRSNRVRVNQSPLPRTRDVLGWVKAVLFSPEDLVLVKGDPSARRSFLDDLMVLQTPRMAGDRADFDRILKQRNTLLKSARESRSRRGRPDEHFESTLQVWSEQLAKVGAQIITARHRIIADLNPLVGSSYADVAHDARRRTTTLTYRPAVAECYETADAEAVEAALIADMTARHKEELDRGLTLVGPHRDEVQFELDDLPVKGYASHGETWSFALALRLASYDLIREQGDDPILILDDVFAELDSERRERLATRVAKAEQVLITAAVEADIPVSLQGLRFDVEGGKVTADG